MADDMKYDLLMQAGLIFLTISMFLFLCTIPQNIFSKLRLFYRLRRQPHLHQARRHFVIGAQLLAEARSSADRSIAERAAAEADEAISLDPSDASHHILKAMALELQGFTTSALDSLDVALSPLAEKSLSDAERGNALFKRAELRAAVGGGGVVEDLVESVRLNGGNATAYCMLGECYEKKGLKEDARKAYENAIRVRPNYEAAQDALARLIPSGSD